MWLTLYYEKILGDREIRTTLGLLTIHKDDCDILGFCWNFSIKKIAISPTGSFDHMILTPCGRQCNLLMEKNASKSENISHPYILSKSPNVVRISLSPNIFS